MSPSFYRRLERYNFFPSQFFNIADVFSFVKGYFNFFFSPVPRRNSLSFRFLIFCFVRGFRVWGEGGMLLATEIPPDKLARRDQIKSLHSTNFRDLSILKFKRHPVKIGSMAG